MSKYLLLVVSVIVFQKPYSREIQDNTQLGQHQNLLVTPLKIAYLSENNESGLLLRAREANQTATKYIGDDSAMIKNSISNLTITINRKAGSYVEIKWVTTSEENNRGFYIQRKVNGKWKNIAFVFSAADCGNSSAELVYRYKDMNSQKKTTQYRIQQIDMSGLASYSEVFLVQGNRRKNCNTCERTAFNP